MRPVHEGRLQLMTTPMMILLAEWAIIGFIVGWMGRGLWDDWRWDKR